MKIESGLAEMIAYEAIATPFRQVDALSTGDFARWLQARGIDLHWETIHQLWLAGVLHPVAILEPALDGLIEPHTTGLEERFVQVDIGYDIPCYADLGTIVPDDMSLGPRTELPSQSAEWLLWHPFQLWVFGRLMRLLDLHLAPEAILRDPEWCAERIRKRGAQVRDQIVEFANSERHASSLRMLALVLAAEPLVHLSINSQIRLRHFVTETLDGYWAWRSEQAGEHLLERVGLALPEAEKWHHDLALDAEMIDPAPKFRILFRHARRERRDGLSGDALRAHGLYDASEILRRYLEQYHGSALPEEDDVRYGPPAAKLKERLYGSPRTADFDRRVFRRIVRQFDLDPQPRTTWFVEGPTEEAFISHFATRLHVNLDRAGVALMNLRGVGGLKDRRLLDLLERFQHEEVFAYVSIDEEKGGPHLRELRRYAKNGLLPAGYSIWRDAFEEANFTLVELAETANRLAEAAGVQAQITAGRIQDEMRERNIRAGTAIERLLRRAHCFEGKGEAWGQALAEWAANHDCPPEVRDPEGRRRIHSLFLRMLRGQHSDYAGTVQYYTVDDTGDLVRRDT